MADQSVVSDSRVMQLSHRERQFILWLRNASKSAKIITFMTGSDGSPVLIISCVDAMTVKL